MGAAKSKSTTAQQPNSARVKQSSSQARSSNVDPYCRETMPLRFLSEMEKTTEDFDLPRLFTLSPAFQ
jgi:hypothetical protein